MRARQPDSSGYVVNDGVRVYYEVHGTGSPTILLMPSWAITQSRMWKMQVPYLARHFRVLTYDPRGNGRSDRPQVDAAYDADRIVDDALAVMDATGTDDAVLVGLCTGALWATMLQQREPGPRARPGRDRADHHPRPAGHRPPPGPRLRGGARHRRGLGQGEPGVLEARLGGLHPLLRRPAGVGAALDQGVRRHGRLGAGHGRGDDAPRRGLLVLAGPDDGRGAGRAVPLDHLPGPGDRRHRGPGHPAGPGAAAGRADRRRRADDRGRRAPRPRPAPGRREPRDQGVRRPDRAAAAAGHAVAVRPRAAAHRAVGVVADRPRATCCATSRSPGPCASGCRTCGSSGWPSRR